MKESTKYLFRILLAVGLITCGCQCSPYRVDTIRVGGPGSQQVAIFSLPDASKGRASKHIEIMEDLTRVLDTSLIAALPRSADPARKNQEVIVKTGVVGTMAKTMQGKELNLIAAFITLMTIGYTDEEISKAIPALRNASFQHLRKVATLRKEDEKFSLMRP